MMNITDWEGIEMNISRRGLFGFLAGFFGLVAVRETTPQTTGSLVVEGGVYRPGPIVVSGKDSYFANLFAAEQIIQTQVSPSTKFEWGPDQWLTYDEGE
ncbi:MAG TPA: hypothetical protein ENI27_04330 [bacterium]|nr:hypothetical protein [bacterium]